MIGKGQIAFERNKTPHFSSGLLPFSKVLLKLNLCEGSEIFSYCLYFPLQFFVCVFLDCGQNGKQIAEYSKKSCSQGTPMPSES